MELVHTIYEPFGPGPHPTMIALHGWGANAHDLLGLAPYVAGGQFLTICPQGRVEVPLGESVGYGWFPLTMGAPPDPVAFARGLADAENFLEAAMQRYPIDRQRLVLLGFSQGGVMAYAWALAQPQRYAGLVALSSWLPKPVLDQLAPADRSTLPTLIHHGSQDELIEVERARESVERLRTLNVPVTYREFDMGHQLTQHSLLDLSAWLEEKVLWVARSA